jgi:hypothetical protein
MNDDELPTRAEVASAYLDGELDAAQRASVSADADTMAMVEAFTQVRNTLGSVKPADDDVKASAISAALAQFDAVQLAATRIPAHVATNVTSLHTRRMRAFRVLPGLAAAAVILVVAIAALNATKGGESKTSSASATQPPAAANAPAGSPVLKAATAPAGTAASGVLATEGAPMVPAVNDANDLARYAASLARDTVAPAATSAAAGANGGASPAASTPGAAPAVPPATCLSMTDAVLGPISVLGTPAFAIRDAATGAVRAIAASNCQVLIPAP